MNIFLLVGNYLKAKPLNTALNILLLALGIAVITVLLLFNNQLSSKISQNSKGIDLVVGAKGSPLQLILCNIFHIDFPTGNIKLKEAERIAHGRLVKKAIPLALGDSYQAYRIIGTSHDYPALYNVTLATGSWWEKDMEVTVGASVAMLANLKLNDTFASSHGLLADGDVHGDHRFTVRGILKPTGTVLDNLILTNVSSIWAVHEEHADKGEHEHEAVPDTTSPRSILVPSVAASDSTKEITAMLLQYRSPLAAIQLPRIVNSQTNMQAASPAFETARLFSILGVGVDILMAFAYVLIIISALSIFIALYNSLKERRYDLAIMRSMGATRLKLLSAILLEGSVLTLLGSILGMLSGHGVLMVLARVMPETQKAGISGLVFYSDEWIILAGSLLLGVLCALIPAIEAYRTNISKVLAGN